MIEIKGISKSYDSLVLDKVSYKFERNKIYVIKGISGCGKTTLLNILGMLDNDYDGEYLCEGEDVKGVGRKRRQRLREMVGYTFQSCLLMSNLTVMDNLLYIHNDKELIECYAKNLKVEHLLKKYPNQLSGGERQRISIIRAMILQPKLILADEPTASLDKENSVEVARAFLSLKSKDRVIIISTHENCFDDIADEIIHLDYGVIEGVQKNDIKVDADCNDEAEPIDNHKKGNACRLFMKILFKRNKDRYRIRALLPMAFVVVAILICFSVKHNFYDECVRYCMEQYPVEMIPVWKESYNNNLRIAYDCTEKFDLYTIATEEYSCYPLLNKKDSVLAYGNLIQYGEFPKKDTEVLVSYEMARYVMGNDNVWECIGREIGVEEVKYTITGVVADMNSDYKVDVEVYEGDIYYKGASETRLVYIPYNSIKQYGELQETEYYMVKVNGLYEKKSMYDYIKKEIAEGTLSVWDEKITEMTSMVSYADKIITATFILAAAMAVVFIKNDIELDLFYRRRELGYLQIFGVKKKKIRLQLILERLIKNILSLIVACIIFYVAVISVKVSVDINGFITVKHIVIVFGIVICISLISVILPVEKFLRKKVLSLITE